jgi:hypothetical protein
MLLPPSTSQEVILVTAIIGLVPSTTRKAATAFILDAVRLTDRYVAELAAELCSVHRPPDLIKLQVEIQKQETAATRFTLLHQQVCYRWLHVEPLLAQRDKLLDECQQTAIDLIHRLAESHKVVIDGNVVRVA